MERNRMDSAEQEEREERVARAARVAVDAESLPCEARAVLTEERGGRVLDALRALVDSNGGDEDEGVAANLLLLAESIAIAGPGWSVLTVDEADALPDNERHQLVPIRRMSSLARITPWQASLLRIELRGEADASLAFVDVDFDTGVIEFESCGGEPVAAVQVADVGSMTALRRAMSVRSPLKGVVVETSGAAKFGTASFAMPPWVGEMAVRWLSHCWRLHAFFHAALPSGISRKLCLNGVYLSRLGGGGDEDEEGNYGKWRLSLVLHESSCRCFCSLWKRSHGSPSAAAEAVRKMGTPKRVSIAFEFCGREKIDRYCPSHPETTGKCFRRPACLTDVCLRATNASISCMHAGTAHASGADAVTRVKLTAKVANDAFAQHIMVVCRSLAEGGHSSSELAEMRSLLDASLSDTVADHVAGRSVGEEAMVERDQTAVAMLASGQFFFAPKQRNGVPKLQQRTAAAVPSFLCEAMATHSHLLPPR